MITEIFFLIFGIVLLVFGSDKFVDSASRIAKKLGISDLVIGLTLVAVGTSLPELASSIVSALKGASSLIVGNLVGSNIANIGLIAGVGAVIANIATHETILKRDGYIMLFITAIFCIFAYTGTITALRGIILILVYIIYTLFLIEAQREIKKLHFMEFMRYIFRLGFFKTAFTKSNNKNKIEKDGLFKEIFISVLSLAALIYGANLVVDNSIILSELFGISQTFIGITLLAVGTSLPELAVTVSAVRKKLNEIALGNIIGSNIANLSLVFGISSLFNTVKVTAAEFSYLIPTVLLFSVLLLLFIRQEWKINRKQGIFLLILYSAYVFFAYRII